jgi:cytochrome c-type biogenesis protein CcmH/NrfG
MEDRPRAILEMDQVLQLNPEDTGALAMRGRIKQEMGDAFGAASDFHEVLRLAPSDWPDRADIEERLREAKRQIEDY